MIDRQHREDINLPNQPFPLFGRMLPSYQDGCWSYRTERFPPEAVSEMCFPDEQYDFDALSQNSIFVGAYDSGHCVGLAILQHSPFRYLYLYDLKVNREMRGRHIGTLLIEQSKEIALQQGYRGIHTVGQHNNLAACLFYLQNGFVIGGLDTHIYRGTAQEGKKDIHFYCDLPAPCSTPSERTEPNA